MPDKLNGLIAASHTPMHSDGSIHFDIIESQVQFYRDNPIDGAFICGTTGEGKLLSLDERKQVAERWLECSRGDFPVVIHVGDDCLSDCVSLAKHAQERGAFAISTLAPSYYRPADVADLVDYCQAVASAAPKLPFYFYHIPTLTHVHFSMLDFLMLAEKQIPTLAGIKYTHNDFVDLLACQRFNQGRYNILFGRDESLLAALSYGIDGAVGSTYNYAAPLYKALIQAFQDGKLDEARDLQAASIELIRVITRYNEIAAGKAIMTHLGVDCGSVRAPLKPLRENERACIDSALQQNRFEPFLCKQGCHSN
ncbi:MAG: dihydrodipicolinate synthetase [bacterium]|nr:dihydrodipicolinate synthetase [bacterium]